MLLVVVAEVAVGETSLSDFLFSLISILIFFCSRPSRRQNPEKNRRTVPTVKMTTSCVKIIIFEYRWTES